MKLYWRFKKDGKWTWAPADVHLVVKESFTTKYVVYRDHEEE